MSFHPSFIQAERLSDGSLYLSEDFPETAIRQSEGNMTWTPQDREELDELIALEVATAKATQRAVLRIEAAGIETVGVAPVISDDGLLLICRRLYGKSLEEEIENGNSHAANKYADTLHRLSGYILSSLETMDAEIMGDIVGSHQYTWEEESVVLHDVSEVYPYIWRWGDENLESSIQSSAMITAASIAADLGRLGPEVDRSIIKNTSDNLMMVAEMSKGIFDKDVEAKKKALLIQLVAASIDNQDALSAIVELDDMSAFSY